jgi:hypothetical protein
MPAMDEAQVIVEFQLPNGDTTWRTFSIDVGPDDTLSSISGRLSEIVEDYENGIPGQYAPPEGIEALVDPSGHLIIEIINWPEFD